MLRPDKTIVTSQTLCPHLNTTNLWDWHDPATWSPAAVPANGASFTLPVGKRVLISSCSFPATYVFGLVTVPATSALVFGDAAITFQATGVNVQVGATLNIGSPTCRIRNKISITLYGKRSSQTNPAPGYVKGIWINGGADIHGVEYFPTWTRLAATGYVGDTRLFIQDCPNWKAGQTIVITTTDRKDSRDWNRNEQKNIVKVEKTTISPTTCVVTIDSGLQYTHYGGFEYQAEVGLLSRNILIQGDNVNSEPTDQTPLACSYGASRSTYPCENSFLTGFGATVTVAGSAVSFGRFSGLELTRVGQTNVIGKYPLHYHMVGNITAPGLFFISDAAVHRSYFRCYTIHGTTGTTLANGVTVTKSVGFDVIGHCFFNSEDGVEDNHTISYNLAAHVHPLGPYWQASEGITDPAVLGPLQNSYAGQSFGSQYTTEVASNPNLILADDISASPFYFTNAYSRIFGNAASGGWGGFTFPNLPTPKGFFATHTWIVPKNRPTLLFQGNSAHSTGFWQSHAAGVYLGGNLEVTNTTTGAHNYTAGRFLPARGTVLNGVATWNKFFDTKVFLSNAGLQSWGDRSEIVRFELHDVQISTNVFGQVWIDNMLVNCRSKNVPTKLNGCNYTGTNTNACNSRDRTYFEGFTGFQFYDTGQSHMITNSRFTNCQSVQTTDTCIYSGKCSMRIFQYLTHSDQFTPGLMQMTRNITYSNVDKNFLMVPSTKAESKITVSGRAANWLDEDGSVNGIFPNERTQIGSNWTGADWWRYNARCQNQQYNWVCPMAKGDSVASAMIHWSTEEALIGSTYCPNGGSTVCPIGGKITHFGRSEANAYDLAIMARATGPIIASQGGWFVKFPGGTPKTVRIDSVQVDHNDVLHVAIPYPAGTTLNVYATAPSWCSGTQCKHQFFPVTSTALVRSAWGDAYFWDNTAQLLHIRVTAFDTFGSKFPGNSTWQPQWNSTHYSNSYFARGGVRLLTTGNSQWGIVIEATSANCASGVCPFVNVPVPAANPLVLPARCASPPSVPTGASLGNCGLNAAGGSTCKPICNPGYTVSGTLLATCNAGTWALTGSCTKTQCPTLPNIENSDPGTCNATTPFSTTCVPICKFGYKGTLSATCDATGNWVTSGVCTGATGCSGVPPIANAVAGTCPSSTAHKATCAPACKTGYTGTLSAYCYFGTWFPTGTCTATLNAVSSSCDQLPEIPNADLGDCDETTGATGTVCTPVCQAGYQGTLSAVCKDSWEITGTCEKLTGSSEQVSSSQNNYNGNELSSASIAGIVMIAIAMVGSVAVLAGFFVWQRSRGVEMP